MLDRFLKWLGLRKREVARSSTAAACGVKADGWPLSCLSALGEVSLARACKNAEEFNSSAVPCRVPNPELVALVQECRELMCRAQVICDICDEANSSPVLVLSSEEVTRLAGARIRMHKCSKCGHEELIS